MKSWSIRLLPLCLPCILFPFLSDPVWSLWTPVILPLEVFDINVGHSDYKEERGRMRMNGEVHWCTRNMSFVQSCVIKLVLVRCWGWLYGWCDDLSLLYKRGGLGLFYGSTFWEDKVLPDRALQISFSLFSVFCCCVVRPPFRASSPCSPDRRLTSVCMCEWGELEAPLLSESGCNSLIID